MSGCDLSHKRIVGTTAIFLLQGVNGREALRLSIARQVHVANVIDRDTISLVIVRTATQVGAVDKRIAARVEFGHKYGKVAFELALESILRGEIGRVCVPYDIGIAGVVYCNTVTLVEIVATQIGGGRISLLR